jgi:ABC-type multidrug transport system fused ATPase/permease subunit
MNFNSKFSYRRSSLSQIVNILNEDNGKYKEIKSRILYDTNDLDFSFTTFENVQKDFKKRKIEKKNRYGDLKILLKLIKKPFFDNFYYFFSYILVCSVIVYFSTHFLVIVNACISDFVLNIQKNSNLSVISLIINLLNSWNGYKLLFIVLSTLLYRIKDRIRLDIDTYFLLRIKEIFTNYLLKKNYLFFTKYGIGKIVEMIDQSIVGIDDLLDLFLGSILDNLLNVIFSFQIIFTYYLQGNDYTLLFIFTILWFFFHFFNMFYYLNVISDALFLSNRYHLVCNSINTDTLYNIDSIKRNSREELEKKVLFRSFFMENLHDRKCGFAFNNIKLLSSLSLFIFRILSLCGIFLNLINIIKQGKITDLKKEFDAVTIFSSKFEFSSNTHELVYSCIICIEYYFRAIPNIKLITDLNYNDKIDLYDDYSSNIFSDDIINEDSIEKMNDKTIKENININNVISDEDVDVNEIKLEKVNLVLNKTKLLKNINLHFEKGKKYGLVGYSGSGKTTLLNVLCRLYELSNGKIIYNKTDISNYSKSDWLSLINYIPQTPLLFNRTILENIIYGVNDFTLSEIVQACKDAYIYDFIRKVPNKFSFIVGNKGEKLSGGQKQRIMLARAFLRSKSKIVLIDEATSALDSKTENIVLKAINNLIKDKISIFISHDIEQFKNFDSIVVMDKGIIVENGTFDELIEKKGFFAKLWEIHLNTFQV